MISAVGVIVPAHDEAATVAACLGSVLAAADQLPPEIEAHVVLVADACSDATASIAAAALAGRGEVVVVDDHRVGAARRVGTAATLFRFTRHDAASVWLANTDADTTVPPSWLADQVRLAHAGAAATAGLVAVASFSDHARVVPSRFHARYPDPVEPHPHVHGANLGVRADVYLGVGGWPRTTHDEDVELWAALVKAGVPVRSTRALRVTTSGRRRGRAAAGFAHYLRDLGEQPA